MKFLIGYQQPLEGRVPICALLEPYWDKISEIFFSWVQEPSGRSAAAVDEGYVDWAGQARLEQDLKTIREKGSRLDLLLNANCYGGDAVSRRLDYRIASILDRIGEVAGGVDVVTTTSPFIAERVRQRYPGIELRASVNMWIGTTQAMEYLSDLYDSFYLQREYNRDLALVRKMSDWCKARGKGLYLLGNSGCLSFCTGHTFHDNLVAHEQEVLNTQCVEGFEAHTCRRFLKDPEHRHAVLQGSWIRPEDVFRYEGLVDGIKLATRTHAHPGIVISSYMRGSFHGNLLDLLEPGYGSLFAPYILDSDLLPADFYDRTSTCGKNCASCGYCKDTLQKILKKV